MRGRERENNERERHCNNKKRVFLFFSFLLLRVSPVITHTKKRGEIKATVGVEENKKGLKMTQITETKPEAKKHEDEKKTTGPPSLFSLDCFFVFFCCSFSSRREKK